MATVTYIRESKQSIGAMKGVIDYCCQDKKVYDKRANQRFVSGVNCNGENAFAEFIATKKAYGKTDGMNYYQYVQSFSPKENITPRQAHEVALEFAEKAWKGYEVLVTTHCDREHIHSHFVINSVSFENGKKLRQSPNTLKTLRASSDEICGKHNLSTLNFTDKSGTKISTREYRTAVKGQSWKFKLMNDIDKAMNISGIRKDFIKAMKIMGYSVTWTDDRKYLTYQCPNGMKCRDIKLHNKKYLKENMENEFRYRQQYFGNAQAEEQRFNDGVGFNVGGNEDNRNSVTGQRGRAESTSDSDNLSAGALQADFKPSDHRANGGLPKSNPENQRGQYGNDFSKLQNGAEENLGADVERNQVGAERNDGNHRTGWEKSRAIFEQYLASRSGTGSGNSFANEENDPADNLKMAGDNRPVLGNINALADSLAKIIDNEQEDEEERRKRIEAEQNGNDIGTLLGLTAGIIAGAISDDEDFEYEYNLVTSVIKRAYHALLRFKR